MAQRKLRPLNAASAVVDEMPSRSIIILLVLLLIVGASIYLVKFMQPKKIRRNLNIAISGALPNEELSPENISTIPLFHLHYNLWDTLVTPDNSGAIAKSFSISPDNLTYSFEIDPNAKFSNGRAISALDVKESIDRLTGREENGHINAKSTIHRIETPSPQSLVIHLIKPTPAFLFLLSSPEFGIVPSEALDSNGAVVSLKITSGAYTLENLNRDSQTAELKRNVYFRRSEAMAPETVTLRFNKKIDEGTFKSLLADDQIDFIELINPDAAQFINLAEKSGYSYKATLPSVSIFLVANDKFVDEKSAKYFSAGFQKHFHFDPPLGLERTSNQFFPPKTFGSLSEEEVPEIESKETTPTIKEVAIRTNRKDGSLVEAIARTFARLGVSTRFVDWDSEEPYHYWFRGQGMNTEHPEIELHLDILSPYQILNADDATKRMLTEATHEPDGSKRSALINEIGKKLLSSGKVIPLTTRAYVHLYKTKSTDLNGITNYDGDIPIYKMRALR
jgi:ABC-type transport system substrate-binding protein